MPASKIKSHDDDAATVTKKNNRDTQTGSRTKLRRLLQSHLRPQLLVPYRTMMSSRITVMTSGNTNDSTGNKMLFITVSAAYKQSSDHVVIVSVIFVR